ncbi:hypothetical protein HDU86_007187 [Geranomyces michiganensis]|nr:hypothetical protein HDU86_007187 [Geranomyces michiganensis]
MKLYCSPTSPYARKALILIHELGLSDRITLIPVRANPNPSVPSDAPILASHNPLAKLPVLVLDDNDKTAIYDSLVICQFLDWLAGGGKEEDRHLGFYPRENDPRRFEKLTLHSLANGITEAASACVYELNPTVRPAEFCCASVIEQHWAKIARGLDQLDAFAVQQKLEAWQLGEVAVVCALGYLDLRFGERKWREGRPALAAWAARMDERESVCKTRPPM